MGGLVAHSCLDTVDVKGRDVGQPVNPVVVECPVSDDVNALAGYPWEEMIRPVNKAGLTSS